MNPVVGVGGDMNGQLRSASELCCVWLLRVARWCCEEFHQVGARRLSASWRRASMLLGRAAVADGMVRVARADYMPMIGEAASQRVGDRYGASRSRPGHRLGLRRDALTGSLA